MPCNPRCQPGAWGGSQDGAAQGQATVELALVLALLLLPLTLGLIAFGEIAWTYHSLATLTRQGARYASTQCWQDSSGSNVVSWMQANAPPFPDRPLLATGEVQILVTYWTHDAVTRESVAFSCAGSCAECVPDSVTVSISGYQFTRFLSTLGFPPLQVPEFSTTVEMESAGTGLETAMSSP